MKCYFINVSNQLYLIPRAKMALWCRQSNKYLWDLTTLSALFALILIIKAKQGDIRDRYEYVAQKHCNCTMGWNNFWSSSLVFINLFFHDIYLQKFTLKWHEYSRNISYSSNKIRKTQDEQIIMVCQNLISL